MNEERMKILEMLANGVISATEANELLSTLDKNKVEVNGKELKEGDALKQNSSRFLHIKVLSCEGDKVNIKLPVNLVKAAIKSGNTQGVFGKIQVNGMDNDFMKNSIDFDMILHCIESDVMGNIIDVESSEGDVVNIYID
jgi:hypothetical protein